MKLKVNSLLYLINLLLENEQKNEESFEKSKTFFKNNETHYTEINMSNTPRVPNSE